MSVEQLEQSVLKLTAEERRRFLYWVDDHRHELLPDEVALDPEVKAEILRRRAEAAAHPKQLDPWDGTTGRVRARLNELRHQKNQGWLMRICWPPPSGMTNSSRD